MIHPQYNNKIRENMIYEINIHWTVSNDAAALYLPLARHAFYYYYLDDGIYFGVFAVEILKLVKI
jgi:hypothetical protein